MKRFGWYKKWVDDQHPEIPHGMYCHGDEHKPCPHWKRVWWRRKQENGYCKLLKRGDWMPGLSHLWDQCKECGINDD